MSKNGDRVNKRFNSAQSANSFASKVGGYVKDLRSKENSKSNFKVEYTRDINRSHVMSDKEARDFDRNYNSENI